MNSGLICIVSPCDWRLQSCKTYLIYKLTTCDSLTASPPQKKALPSDSAMLLLTFGATLALSILSNKPKAGCHWRPWVLSCICWAKIDTHQLQSTHKLLTRCNFYKLQWLHCSKWYLAKPAQVFLVKLSVCAFVRHRFKITTVDAWNASSWEALYSCSLCYLIHGSQEFCHHWGSKCPTLPGHRICHHAVQHAQSR